MNIIRDLFYKNMAIVVFLLPTTDVIASPIWEPLGAGAGDMEFGILSTIDGVSVAGPSALETGYNGAYSFPRSPLGEGEGNVIGWGQTFSVSTDRELSAVQLRISRFGSNTPTGIIEVGVSEFIPGMTTAGATIASTTLFASNFNAPLGSDVPIFTVDLSASGGQLDSARIYLLSLVSMGGFGETSVAPYAATDIYSGGNSYYLYEEFVPAIPVPASLGLMVSGMIALLGFRRRIKRG